MSRKDKQPIRNMFKRIFLKESSIRLSNYSQFTCNAVFSPLVQVLSGHEGPVSNLCFSPVKSVLASVSWDKTVRLWDMLDSWQTKETMWLTSDGRFTRCQVETWYLAYYIFFFHKGHKLAAGR